MTNLQRWILIALLGVFLCAYITLNRYVLDFHTIGFIRYDKITQKVDFVTPDYSVSSKRNF